ncbi:MAG: hypothetical protein ACPG1A_15180 [Halioglobus sp.]
MQTSHDKEEHMVCAEDRIRRFALRNLHNQATHLVRCPQRQELVDLRLFAAITTDTDVHIPSQPLNGADHPYCAAHYCPRNTRAIVYSARQKQALNYSPRPAVDRTPLDRRQWAPVALTS